MCFDMKNGKKTYSSGEIPVKKIVLRISKVSCKESSRSESLKEEKGMNNENLQDMCKNHQDLQQKKEGICKIYYLWVSVITPDICQIIQEKHNGKSKMVLFCMKK